LGYLALHGKVDSREVRGFRMSNKKKTRRQFAEEFKAETVKRVKQSDRTMSAIAMELGISAKSVGEWVRNAAD